MLSFHTLFIFRNSPRQAVIPDESIQIVHNDYNTVEVGDKFKTGWICCVVVTEETNVTGDSEE